MKPTNSKSKLKGAKVPPAKLVKPKALPKPPKPKAKSAKAAAAKPATAKLEEGIVIRVHAPSAHSVCVAGTFNGWSAGADPLSPAAGGEWRRVLPLGAGRYEYLFVVDGAWMPDPVAREHVPNEFGGLNSVLSVN